MFIIQDIWIYKVSYPLVALSGMNVTLLDSSVSFFFFFFVVGVPMFVFATWIN